MTEAENHPRIRLGLDYFPVQYEGQEMICLRDPLQVAPDPILVAPHTFFLIAQMDGENTILDIQTAFTRQFGQLIMRDQVLELVSNLREKGFLDGGPFRDRLRRIEAEYRKGPVRPCSHAGQAYPEDPEEIRIFLDRLFEGIGGTNGPSPKVPAGRVAGVIAPHIDLHRGGHLFARAYSALGGSPPPSTALLLGTAHFGDGGLYILSAKDYETPLGRAEADRAFCDALLESCSFDLTRGELAHRSEHSLEFQVLLLQHVLGPSRMPRIVPILCTSVMERLREDESPSSLAEVAELIGAARRAIEAAEAPVLVVAGADMSHVGRKFATAESLSTDYIEKVRREDREALEAAAAGGADDFFACVARIGNRNNICSVASIYTLLKLLEGRTTGRLLGYDMAVDRENDSAVGFAALNFIETDPS